MKYPKNRIKLFAKIETIIFNLDCYRIDSKEAARMIVNIVQNNYRRRRK